MSEDSNVSQSHVISLDRYRNPTFSREEIEALVKLVEKYKAIILNKSTVAAVNHAKEAAWIKIAELFNSQGFRYTRRPDCLKTKWENLKRTAKKVSNNLMDPKYDEFNDLTNPVVTLLCEAEMSSNMIEVPQEIKEELKQAMNEQKMDNSEKTSDNNYNKQESDNSDGDNEYRKMRSLNFSPQESSILLKCVKEEQKFVFSKENTKNAIQLKRRAWSRITEAFNKRSPQKRSTMTLQTKFCNMKRNVKHRYFKKYLSNKRHEKLIEEEIKAEPSFESKPISDVDEDNNGEDSDDNLDDVLPRFASKHLTDIAQDPINTAFGSESGPDGDNELRRNRSLNFSPHEVNILLKCVKEENKYIFCKDNTARAIHQKNKAWSRRWICNGSIFKQIQGTIARKLIDCWQHLKITEAFNKETRQERSTRVLRTKFANLKKNMRFGSNYFRRLKSNQHEKLQEENSKDIKAEPHFEYRSDSDNNDEGEDEDCVNDVLADSVSNQSPEPAPDPLATVLSSDSGLGSTSFIGAYNFGNNEVTKLKMELLKCQLDNAKLERQRIQEAIKAEAATRDSMAIERCLRLRAARLEAVAAELKLPAAHPSLQFTFDETPAQQYMSQCHQ